MRKPRSDSVLKNLPEDQKSQLCDWLLAGMPYHQVKVLLKKEFDVATSNASLSEFYQHYCAAALLHRRRLAVDMAEEIANAASQSPGTFDEATISMLKQLAFELSVQPGTNPKDIKSIFGLILKARDQELEERQLDLKVKELEARQKKAKDELELVKKTGGLSEETRKRIEEAANLL